MTQKHELLSGWGRTQMAAAEVRSLPPGRFSPIPPSPRGVIARGLGRSYGDAAQRSGGTVMTLDHHRTIEWLEGGRVRVGGGATYEDLISEVVPRGFFVPVTPGTRSVTMGGALAADIHGKNHHRDGSLADHVEEITLLAPNGDERVASPAVDSDLFWGTVGGMGLTGLILSVTLRLIPIETSAMVVDTQRTPALEPLMEMMAEGDDRHRYSVAWVDLMSTGPQFGRGIWLRGDHAEIDLLPRRQRSEPLAYRSPRSVALPVTPPFGLVNRVTARVFNEAWYRKGPGARSGELKSIPSFFHPLDAIRNWNVAYGPAGFVQYQFVVPNGGEQALITAARGIAGSGFPNSLTVLKRMGRDGRGMLSFPMEGWTLAVDLPAAAGVGALLDRLDEHVADAGGRLYLAKDSRMTPEIFRRMYPRLDEFVDLRRRIDPGSVLRSDLSVRLEIP